MVTGENDDDIYHQQLAQTKDVPDTEPTQLTQLSFPGMSRKSGGPSRISAALKADQDSLPQPQRKAFAETKRARSQMAFDRFLTDESECLAKPELADADEEVIKNSLRKKTLFIKYSHDVHERPGSDIPLAAAKDKFDIEEAYIPFDSVRRPDTELQLNE